LPPQSQVLQDQFPMSAEGQRQSANDHGEQLQHAPIVAGRVAKINGDEFWRGSETSHASHLRHRLCALSIAVFDSGFRKSILPTHFTSLGTVVAVHRVV
jgi:hypothetical protein